MKVLTDDARQLPKELCLLQNEAAVMAEMSHSCIQRLYAVVVDVQDTVVGVVLEVFSSGWLSDVLKEKVCT